MSNQILTSMLRLNAPSAPAQPPQRAAEENRAGGSELSDDSFSRALDRRMNAAERSPARPERERPQERATQAAERPRSEARSETRRSGESSATSQKNETNDAEATATETTGAETTGENTASDTSTTEGGAQDGNAAQPDTAAADPAAQAASLAALMPGVAALPADDAAAEGDSLLTSDVLLDTPKRKSGAFTLGQLIAEATAQTESSEKAGADAGGAADAVAKVKADITAGSAPAAFGARLQMASQQPAPPAPGLQALEPDAQAAGLHASAFAPGTTRTEQTPPQLPVHTPAGQRAWAEDVGNRMMWMVGRNESRAELVLTPAHLGKLEVSIQVNGDQTTAHFVAASAAARDALEQALPRLREVLQQAGINLGQTNVSTQGDQRAQQDSGTGTGRGQRGATGADQAGEVRAVPLSPASWSRTGLGMVDIFA
ncbi:flagellar hook-length control protein FliK [Aromatoleum tolulyticum]|uniref:Flagellar hook-length control protein FliK n=1 Tax=Aromatoleum tolulyticum TaxID=34027 RepID=A0A1N7CBR0_9RHOO|nr:flagellar hook-length control protein FliK [Aromatoleum tolulyticum]SIR61020.1 flagellar hook-length control protein FliK [Aromatoleum tolulyticum]